jgi:hypothetical protein
MFDTLEARRLLSSGVVVSQSGSTLNVIGGANGSVISVRESAHSVVVEDQGAVIFTGNGIDAINIKGQAKDDEIFYTGDSVGANISSGGGNDRLTVTDQGTAGSYASGDGGDDSLVVLMANNTTLVGDGGGDTLHVSNAIPIGKNLHLYGMGGADFFSVAGGTNYIYGGGGQDNLVTNGTAGVNFAVIVVDSVESIENIP